MRRLWIALALTISWPVLALAQTATRLSWETFAKDPKNVASLRKAVATMKSHNTDSPTSKSYRLSWQYWGNMHGYFGTQSPDGTIEAYIQYMKDNGLWDPSYAPYFAGITDQTPPDAVAKAVWAQCQHGTPWFYAWHRLYLYYFEKVLQVSAGDPNLRLPYWDYDNPAQLAMPAEFTTPTYVNESGQTVPNPLFESRRAPGWATPSPNRLDATDTNITSALKIPKLLDYTSGGKAHQGYQSVIENSPHGYVHCSVMDCPVTVMGAVPYSSNDPIFWLHHANIDRTWDCWTSISGHTNPPGTTFNNKKFSFVDQTGTMVTKQVKVLFNGTLIDYKYEHGSNCGTPTLAAAAPAAAAAPMTAEKLKSMKAKIGTGMLLGRAKAVAINAPSVTATMAVPAQAASMAHDLALLPQAEVPVKLELVLHGIHYQAHPGTMFHVFLARKDDPTKRALVGTISFFVSLRGPHAAHGTPDRTFDVTDELQALAAAETGLKEVEVIFDAIPSHIGETETIHFNARKAKLTVDDISLRVSTKE
jgi:hypothetical protein